MSTVVELFSGAGGLSLGLKRAGFQHIAAVERDVHCVQTYEANFPGANILSGDIRDFDLYKYRGADLVAGGPPCQPFSSMGKGERDKDPRDMVPHFVRAVATIKPRVFLMENVPGLLAKKNQEYLDYILSLFLFLGYDVQCVVLDASRFQVPQHRKRAFIAGTLEPNSFAFPEGSSRQISAGSALFGARRTPPNPCIVTYCKTPVLRDSPHAGMLVNGRGRPLDLMKPGPTILATTQGNGAHIVDEEGVLVQYHWELLNGGRPRTGIVRGARRLSVGESAAIQAFPVGFEFFGPRTSQLRQIGNAVPPPLAQALGESIQHCL